MVDAKTGIGRMHLELRGVSRRFGEVQAVDDVSLSVRQGDIVCLVGRSGCGKSSLLRIVAGIDFPDRGQVFLAGEEVSGPTLRVEPENRNVGFMFQDYALFPHLTVTGNIMFGLKRMERGKAAALYAEIIERLGIGHLAHRYPHMLSGGEQQRVALARALAPQPRIMLMDEPFSNLDRVLRNGIRAETVALLHELGTTAIMVTHDPEEALSTGDLVVLMRDGAIVQSGSGEDLYENPKSAYAADFFCTFNKVPVTCISGIAETPFGRFAAAGIADGETATVYIRPHCLRLGDDRDGVECRVLERALVGEIEQISLEFSALPAPLTLRSTARSHLRSGDIAYASVARDQVLVF